jgi:hypothetical protein
LEGEIPCVRRERRDLRLSVSSLDGKCFDDSELRGGGDDSVEAKTGAGQQVAIFVYGALAASCQNEHDDVDEFAV